MRVRTAVVPAGGHGHPLPPATKAVPKELFPIIDTPALQLIIDEAVGAGVDHMVIVTSHAKPAIEAYFQPQPEVIAKLRSSGRDDMADRLESTRARRAGELRLPGPARSASATRSDAPARRWVTSRSRCCCPTS
jgi:UTP--glucose-1-phosphate uridylyltransferase